MPKRRDDATEGPDDQMSKLPPFKSERAAKMAYTKAENTWKAMTAVSSNLTWERRRKMQGDDESMDWAEYQEYERKIAEADAAAHVLFEKMREIFNQAESQWKHSMPTWYFGNNPTRDLIRANMD
jgi:uncharacterized protein (DUF1800 family)